MLSALYMVLCNRDGLLSFLLNKIYVYGSLNQSETILGIEVFENGGYCAEKEAIMRSDI